MNAQDPKNEVKQGLLARQTRIAIAGLLGVGVVGLSAGLLLQKPAQIAKGSDIQLLPVSAKAPASSSNLATKPASTLSSPTVRTQQPLKVPELPFLVSKAGTLTSSATTAGKPAETLSPTGVSSSTGLKNPFRPFRLDKQVTGTGVPSNVDQGATDAQIADLKRKADLAAGLSGTKTPIVIDVPPVVKSNSDTEKTSVVQKSIPLPNPGKTVMPATAVVTLAPSPAATKSPIIVLNVPKIPTAPIRVIRPAPKPTLKAPTSLQPSNLPENLSQGTLSVIPPVLRDTISPQNSMPQGEEAPVMVPETLPDINVSSLPATAGVPLETVSDTAQDVPNLIAPGDKVMPDPPVAVVIKLPSALETLVKDRDLTFSTAVLGPINTAIFRNKNGFSVVQLGQTLPGSSAVVQSITAEKVILQLGEDKLELNLDRR